MNSSNFCKNQQVDLVADASVVINLNASGCAGEILRAIPHRVVVTEQAWKELENGTSKGYRDAVSLDALIREGLVCRVKLGDAALNIYERLISGSTFDTLDDGEAATISYSVEARGIALIDDKKAHRIAVSNYPSLEVLTTAAILLNGHVAQSIGAEKQRQAIINALLEGRMRVPYALQNCIAELVPEEVVKSCLSLPARIRSR